MAGRHRRLSKKDLEFIVNDIGDELLPLFSPEDRLRGLSPRELIKYLNPEERRMLKKLLEDEKS